MGYFHTYDPWSFAGEGNGRWGTEADRRAVAERYQRVADWSAANGIPVMNSEFGVVRETPFNDRMAFYAAYVEEAVRHGMAFQVWDDGGMFEVYDRPTRTWNEEKDVLIHVYPDGPTGLTADVVGDTLVVLTWTNRTTQNAAVVVERRMRGGTFAPIAELPANAARYEDVRPEGGRTYQYRVIARFGRGADRYSHPIEVFVRPTVRSGFLGAPLPIPGVIQAEDFDVGGEGLTYHDTDPENIPGAPAILAKRLAPKVEQWLMKLVSRFWSGSTHTVTPCSAASGPMRASSAAN